jgi:hypothetical protein
MFFIPRQPALRRQRTTICFVAGASFSLFLPFTVLSLPVLWLDESLL